jgi:hypothetical protein
MCNLLINKTNMCSSKWLRIWNTAYIHKIFMPSEVFFRNKFLCNEFLAFVALGTEGCRNMPLSFVTSVFHFAFAFNSSRIGVWFSTGSFTTTRRHVTVLVKTRLLWNREAHHLYQLWARWIHSTLSNPVRFILMSRPICVFGAVFYLSAFQPISYKSMP